MKWSNLTPLRVAIVDDHALIRHGFLTRLEAERDIKVVSLYAGSLELLAGLTSVETDVLVLDYVLSHDEIDGLSLIKLLRIRYPAMRLLVCSAVESPATISLSLRAGVQGFVGKSRGLDELVTALRTVGRDQVYLDPLAAFALGRLPQSEEGRQTVPVHLSSRHNSLVDSPLLSPRESEVLRCCLEGLSVSQIAAKFSRSRKTISGQKQSAFRKLGVSKDMELFKILSELQA